LFLNKKKLLLLVVLKKFGPKTLSINMTFGKIIVSMNLKRKQNTNFFNQNAKFSKVHMVTCHGFFRFIFNLRYAQNEIETKIAHFVK
jgi:hypothetical protein